MPHRSSATLAALLVAGALCAAECGASIPEGVHGPGPGPAAPKVAEVLDRVWAGPVDPWAAASERARRAVGADTAPAVLLGAGIVALGLARRRARSVWRDADRRG